MFNAFHDDESTPSSVTQSAKPLKRPPLPGRRHASSPGGSVQLHSIVGGVSVARSAFHTSLSTPSLRSISEEEELSSLPSPPMGAQPFIVPSPTIKHVLLAMGHLPEFESLDRPGDSAADDADADDGDDIGASVEQPSFLSARSSSTSIATDDDDDDVDDNDDHDDDDDAELDKDIDAVIELLTKQHVSTRAPGGSSMRASGRHA